MNLSRRDGLIIKILRKQVEEEGASAGPINTSGTYWKKENIINTNKWSTGYLNPKGNGLKVKYETLSLKELQTIAEENNVPIQINQVDKTKDDLMYDIIKQQKGISNMKVNNQVASNPIGFIEEMKNMAKLPCRLTHFTRTNYEKYKDGLPFIQRN